MQAGMCTYLHVQPHPPTHPPHTHPHPHPLLHPAPALANTSTPARKPTPPPHHNPHSHTLCNKRTRLAGKRHRQPQRSCSLGKTRCLSTACNECERGCGTSQHPPGCLVGQHARGSSTDPPEQERVSMCVCVYLSYMCVRVHLCCMHMHIYARMCAYMCAYVCVRVCV